MPINLKLMWWSNANGLLQNPHTPVEDLLKSSMGEYEYTPLWKIYWSLPWGSMNTHPCGRFTEVFHGGVWIHTPVEDLLKSSMGEYEYTPLWKIYWSLPWGSMNTHPCGRFTEVFHGGVCILRRLAHWILPHEILTIPCGRLNQKVAQTVSKFQIELIAH